ncbi:MAG: hypothetical protein GY694_15265 [Gammaproteobacteria bacterium]|nr:hypothetical protein [Gammaproteobacteria bacterium]
MTIIVNYIDNNTGVEILASGKVTGKEIIHAHQKVYAEDKLANQRYHIIDKSLCTEYDVTAEDINTICQLDKKAAQVNPNIVVAIVESKSLEFSLSEVWQAYVEPFIQHTHSFKHRADAEQWIKESLR